MLRRAPRVPALALAGALALAACGGGSGGSGTPAASTLPADDGAAEPAPDEGDPEQTSLPGGATIVTLPSDAAPATATAGGTLRIAVEAEVEGLNPAVDPITAPSGLMMTAAVFDTLAATAADGRVVPYLAESFTPDATFTVWDVRLRPGITFHDGSPLDALAVQANFEAQRTGGKVGLAVRPFYPETNATEIVDELTIRFHLLDPNAYWPAFLTSQLGMMASPAWLAAAAADPALNQAPVGTGPFEFAARVKDSYTEFVRNENYWNGPVHLDAVQYLPNPDQQYAANLLATAEIDALHSNDPSAILGLQDDTTFQHMEDDSGDERFVMLNTQVPPFDDPRAREALALATPRQAVLDLIGQGLWPAADDRFTADSPYHNPAVTQLADGPDRARALATEYCAEHGADVNPVLERPVCTDGRINIQYQWSSNSTIQLNLADLLIDNGWSLAFDVTRNPVDQQTHITEAALGAFNTASWNQFGDPEPVIDNVWLLCRTTPSEPGGVAINFARSCDPERDTLLLQAAATTDAAERAGLLRQAEARINASGAYVFLGHMLWHYALGDHVRGVCDRESPDGVALLCVRQGTFWPTTIWLD